MVGTILEDANNPGPLGIHAVLTTHDPVQLLRLPAVWGHWQKGWSFPSSQQTQLSSDLPTHLQALQDLKPVSQPSVCPAQCLLLGESLPCPCPL